jgi:hypothetical protein
MGAWLHQSSTSEDAHTMGALVSPGKLKATEEGIGVAEEPKKNALTELANKRQKAELAVKRMENQIEEMWMAEAAGRKGLEERIRKAEEAKEKALKRLAEEKWQAEEQRWDYEVKLTMMEMSDQGSQDKSTERAGRGETISQTMSQGQVETLMSSGTCIITNHKYKNVPFLHNGNWHSEIATVIWEDKPSKRVKG